MLDAEAVLGCTAGVPLLEQVHILVTIIRSSLHIRMCWSLSLRNFGQRAGTRAADLRGIQAQGARWPAPDPRWE